MADPIIIYNGDLNIWAGPVTEPGIFLFFWRANIFLSKIILICYIQNNFHLFKNMTFKNIKY